MKTYLLAAVAVDVLVGHTDLLTRRQIPLPKTQSSSRIPVNEPALSSAGEPGSPAHASCVGVEVGVRDLALGKACLGAQEWIGWYFHEEVQV
jgi:hypothetical protein